MTDQGGNFVHRRKGQFAGFVVSFLLLINATAQTPGRIEAADRIYAFGDVHGAYSELEDLLQAHGIIDEDLKWSGGTSHLVSVGDLLDRGPDSRRVMDLLMRLQAEADSAGGGVHVVMGNHEMMNLMGDLRYVSDGEYSAFAPDETPEMREAALAGFQVRNPNLTEEQARIVFADRYPAGYFALREAFGAEGHYGEWLLSLPAILIVNDTLFTHGGLSGLISARSVAEINGEIRAVIDEYREVREQLAALGIVSLTDTALDFSDVRAALEALTDDSVTSLRSQALRSFEVLAGNPLLGPDGPLWYRGSAQCKRILEEPVLTAALANFGVTRAVIGHTPTADARIDERFDQRLLMIDTGMLGSYYGGRPALLEISGTRTEVHYAAPPESDAAIESAPVAMGLTEAEIFELLGTAAVASPPATTRRASRLTLTDGDFTAEAVFIPGQAGAFEIAAHQVDSLLGFDLVPPTVGREIEGTFGAVQLWFPESYSEATRIAENLQPAGNCDVAPQAVLMLAFDFLIGHSGRTAETLRYHPATGNIFLVNHDSAFSRDTVVPFSDPTRLPLTTAMLAALARLDRRELESVIDDGLPAARIEAILSRRDNLLALYAAQER